MTDEQILKKAIEKAIDNEYKFVPFVDWEKHPEEIIFSHAFAKSFFGKAKTFMKYVDGEAMYKVDISELPSKDDEKEYWVEYKAIDGWQYHLKQMVLKSKPLLYLEKNL